jgi:hypothetical protein
MDELIKWCRTCKDFRKREQLHHRNGHFYCVTCNRTTLDKATYVPINAEVNELIRRCTRATGKQAIDVIKEALMMYILARGYDD